MSTKVKILVWLVISLLFSFGCMYLSYISSNESGAPLKYPNATLVGDKIFVPVNTFGLVIIHGGVGFVSQKGVAVPYVTVSKSEFAKLVKLYDVKIGYVVWYPGASNDGGIAFIHSGGIYVYDTGYLFPNWYGYVNGSFYFVYDYVPLWAWSNIEVWLFFFVVIGSLLGALIFWA